MYKGEQHEFAYEIWELENKVQAAETHISDFKQTNKHFKKAEVRPKGVDTIFYEMNLPEWKKRLEISLKQFEKDYEQSYERSRINFN